jgi:hypothetical protein
MVCNVVTVAFHDPLQPIFDFAESAHAGKYARRIGDFPARNAALFKLTPLPKGRWSQFEKLHRALERLVRHRQVIPALISPQKPHSVTDLPCA